MKADLQKLGGEFCSLKDRYMDFPQYGRQRKSYLHSGFVEWVEQITAEGPDVTMDLYDLSNKQAPETSP